MSWNALLQVLNPVWISCYLGLDQIMSWTFFNYTPSVEVLWNYLNSLCWSNSLTFLFFQTASLLLNLCLCYDLIMTMYSPFSPASSRMKWYLGLSSIGPLAFVLVIFWLNDLSGDQPAGGNCIDTFYAPSANMYTTTKIQNQGNLVMAMLLSIYILVAIYSVVYSYRRLMRPGVSKTTKEMFFRKHFYYVCVFIALWTIQ